MTLSRDNPATSRSEVMLSTEQVTLHWTDRTVPGGSYIAQAAGVIGGLTGFRRAALAIVMGGLAALAFAPLHFIPLLFLAFTVLTWQIDGLGTWQKRLRMSALLGWCFGLGFFAVSLEWIGNAFLVDAATFGAIMPFAMALLAGGMAIFPAIAIALARRFWTSGSSRVLVLALSWVFVEWIRSWIFTGFPWALVGYVWGDTLSVMQSTAVFGIFGLSLATVAIAAAPALLADWKTGSAGPGTQRTLIWIAGVWLSFVLLAAWGAWRLADNGPVLTDTSLRIVQASIPQEEKLDRANAADIYRRQMELTRREGLADQDIVIWTEAAVPFLLAREYQVLADVGETLRDGQYFIVGSTRLEAAPRAEDYRFFNSMHVVDARGEIVATYDKHHLVPFGEYLPFGELLERLGLTKLVGGKGSYTAGNRLQTLQLSGAPDIGPLICYEAIFPGQTVDPAKRPAWLLNLTDDTWFGLRTGPYQHLEIARARAIEEGLPIVRAANNGVSAIVGPKGRVTMSLDLNKIDVIDGHIPAALSPTLFATFGNVMFFLFATCLIFVIVSARVRTDSEEW